MGLIHNGVRGHSLRWVHRKGGRCHWCFPLGPTTLEAAARARHAFAAHPAATAETPAVLCAVAEGMRRVAVRCTCDGQHARDAIAMRQGHVRLFQCSMDRTAGTCAVVFCDVEGLGARVEGLCFARTAQRPQLELLAVTAEDPRPTWPRAPAWDPGCGGYADELDDDYE